MSGKDVIPFGVAVAGDVLSAFQIPGGNSFVSIAEAFVAKKQTEAANILIDEIRGGHHGTINFDQHDLDPLIDIILRFSKAVGEGAARENLRLLAQIIVGLKKNKALDGDQFRRWCGILEHLTRDELLVIGMGYAAIKEIRASKMDVADDDFWQRLQEALKKAGYTDGEIVALCASVSRTGVLRPASAFSRIAYMPTPWLDQLGELADLESLK